MADSPQGGVSSGPVDPLDVVTGLVGTAAGAPLDEAVRTLEEAYETLARELAALDDLGA